MSESAWLIEAAGPKYWTGKGRFIEDVNDACRFARFIDAEVVRCYLLPDTARELSVCREHLWMPNEPLTTPPPPAAPRPVAEQELCRLCEGNGVLKIPGGVSACPRCRQTCYEPPTAPTPSREDYALHKDIPSPAEAREGMQVSDALTYQHMDNLHRCINEQHAEIVALRAQVRQATRAGLDWAIALVEERQRTPWDTREDGYQAALRDVLAALRAALDEQA